ncbi:MAG TPA: hypothetical protein VES89_10750 [Candidatus Competibacteraceae bacterium]|nr:hypothetical protein [Candidatus Competibacteraceae bacterium]
MTQTRYSQGHSLIPAFSTGRTQELLYGFNRYFQAWGLEHWLIFLDSPMAIEITAVYQRHRRLYED